MIPTLAQLNPFVVTGLVVLFLVVCVAMILLILIQRPQGGGLSGAFGAGGGAGQTAFGTKTGDVLTLVTIGIFVLFLVTAVVLNFAARPSTAPRAEPVIQQLGDGEEPQPETGEPLNTGDSPTVPDADGAATDSAADADGETSDAGGDAAPEVEAEVPDPVEEDGTP